MIQDGLSQSIGLQSGTNIHRITGRTKRHLSVSIVSLLLRFSQIQVGEHSEFHVQVVLQSGTWLHVALQVRARDITASCAFLSDWDPASATALTKATNRNRRMVRPKRQ
jgi:hypothetical protein